MDIKKILKEAILDLITEKYNNKKRKSNIKYSKKHNKNKKKYKSLKDKIKLTDLF